eukprot:3074356-Prymnesium_polylepis.1
MLFLLTSLLSERVPYLCASKVVVPLHRPRRRMWSRLRQIGLRLLGSSGKRSTSTCAISSDG